jgi:hypothetical protein
VGLADPSGSQITNRTSALGKLWGSGFGNWPARPDHLWSDAKTDTGGKHSQCEIVSKKTIKRHDEGFIQIACPNVDAGCCVSRHAICKRDGMVHPVDVAFASKYLRADELADHAASLLLGGEPGAALTREQARRKKWSADEWRPVVASRELPEEASATSRTVGAEAAAAQLLRPEIRVLTLTLEAAEGALSVMDALRQV